MNRSPVAVILGAELRAWRNRILKSPSPRSALIAFVLLIGALVVGGSVFALADGAAQILPTARDAMLVGSFSALSILMLVVGFPTVIANFYVGSDLVQLVLAPVRPIEIFIARAILAMRANLLLGFVIAAFVLGVGAGSAASPAYYVVAVLLIALQVLLVTAVQAILLSFVLRLVPARLARDVAVAVASISGAGVYLLWQVTLRQTIGRKPDVSGLVSFAQHVDWLPSAWPGHALSAALDGSLAASLAWLGLSVAVSCALIGVAGALYGSTLPAGIGQLGGAPSRWRATKGARTPRSAAGEKVVSPELAIARKDWISYRRDVRRLSRLVPAVIFLCGYALVLNRPTRGLTGFWNDVFVIAFISMFMSLAVATSAIPSERRGFQLLRLAPFRMSQLLRAKILLTMMPIVGLSLVICIVIAATSGSTLEEVVQLVGLALWLGLGFVAIGVSAGAIDPRFEAVDDRRMVGPLGTLTGLGAELGFGALSVLAFVLFHVAARVYEGVPVGTLPSSPAFALVFAGGGVVVAVLAAVVVALLVRSAASRLRSFEQAIASS